MEGLNPCSHMQRIGAVFLNVMMTSGVTGFTFLYHETQVNTPKTFVVYSFLSFIRLKNVLFFLFLVTYHAISEQVLYLVPTSCTLFLTTAGGQGSISCTQQLCELLTRTA